MNTRKSKSAAFGQGKHCEGKPQIGDRKMTKRIAQPMANLHQPASYPPLIIGLLMSSLLLARVQAEETDTIMGSAATAETKAPDARDPGTATHNVDEQKGVLRAAVMRAVFVKIGAGIGRPYREAQSLRLLEKRAPRTTGLSTSQTRSSLSVSLSLARRLLRRQALDSSVKRSSNSRRCFLFYPVAMPSRHGEYHVLP